MLLDSRGLNLPVHARGFIISWSGNGGSTDPMLTEESKALELGQPVSWNGSRKHTGIVLSVDWSGVEIDWSDGKCEYRHHTNMEDIRSEKSSSGQHSGRPP
jgi:hypothetical protein